jgi:hypothetical protein
MEALIGVLAVIGLVSLVSAAVRWYQQQMPEPPVEVDLARPYREGLHAAIRMQNVAQDLEQQMYAEAIRHAEHSPGGET